MWAGANIRPAGDRRAGKMVSPSGGDVALVFGILVATPISALILFLLFAVFLTVRDGTTEGLSLVQSLMETFLRGTAEIIAALRRRSL